MAGSINIAIFGRGALAKAIELEAKGDKELQITLISKKQCDALLFPPQDASKASNALYEQLLCADLLIDAALSEGLEKRLSWWIETREQPTPVLIATTGWEKRPIEELVEGRLAALYAPNLSLGFLAFREALFQLTRNLQEILQETHKNRLSENQKTNPSRIHPSLAGVKPPLRAHLCETHRLTKKDAPSGSALQIKEELHALLPKEHPLTIMSVRQGLSSAQQAPSCSSQEFPSPQLVAKHQLLLQLEEEELVISHATTSRAPYARGALLIARQIVKKWRAKELPYALRELRSTNF